MEHLVFGAGLIGGYLGAALMQSQRSVGWVVRPATREKLSSGLRVTDYAGHDGQVKNLVFVDPQSPPVEKPAFLWLTIKCTALEKAVDEVRSVVGKDTVIICLQNGLGAEGYIQSQFPEHKVIRGVMAANVAEMESGHLHRGTEGGIDLPRLPETERLTSSFQSSALPLGLYDDLEGLLWAKLQLNLNNPINALSNIPLKAQLSQRGYRRVLAAAQRELLQVAEAKAITLPKLTKLKPTIIPALMSIPDWLFTRLSGAMLAIDPKARSSMWADLSEGRLTEIDFLNGAVADEGRRLGIDCPVNESIRQMIHAVEQGKQSTGMSAKELQRTILK